MKKLQILRVDNDLVQKADLQIGNNIIGPSVTTDSDNGQIIKHAVTINLSPDYEMTITPHQVSPCFMKSTESMRWQLLKSGATVPIKPGDICSLLKDKCWFKVVLISDTMESNEEHASKRQALTAVDCDLPCKKHCSESGEGDVKVRDEMINMNKENLLNNETVTNVAVQNIKESHCTSSTNEDKMHALDVKSICMPQSTDQSSSLVQDELKLQDTNEIISKDITSEKTPAIRREKCKYGKKCYRRNLQHKAEFSHPEDPDYDIPDDRKECPYGTRCYRKNLRHTMEYKHTASNESHKYRKKTPTQVPSSTLSDIEDLSTDESEEESIDESEYDPSDDVEYSSDDEQLFEFLDDYEYMERGD